MISVLSFSGWIKLDQNGTGYVMAKRSQTSGYWRLVSMTRWLGWFVREIQVRRYSPITINRMNFPGNTLSLHGLAFLEIPI